MTYILLYFSLFNCRLIFIYFFTSFHRATLSYMYIFVHSLCVPGSAVGQGADQMVYIEMTQTRQI